MCIVPLSLEEPVLGSPEELTSASPEDRRLPHSVRQASSKLCNLAGKNSVAAPAPEKDLKSTSSHA